MLFGGEGAVGESDVDVEVVAGVVEPGEVGGSDRLAGLRAIQDLADSCSVGHDWVEGGGAADGVPVAAGEGLAVEVVEVDGESATVEVVR
jgi:hypothetical protein